MPHAAASWRVLILAPQLAWLGAFVVTPLCAIALLSLLLPDGTAGYADEVTLANYARLLDEPYPAVFVFSAAVAAATTVLCLLIAFPLAAAIAFAARRWHPYLLCALCLPFWISTLVRMYALQEILGRGGIVNQALATLSRGVSGLLPFVPAFEPLELIYNRAGVLIGLVYALIPFAVLPIYACLARIDRSLLEASRDLGASAAGTLLRVLLPLSLPGVAAATVLIFVPALGAFYIVDMLGGPGELLIGNLIVLQFHDANNWPLGAALSVAMLACTLAALFAAAKCRRYV